MIRGRVNAVSREAKIRDFKNAMIDVRIVLQRANTLDGTQDSFERVGYFEQYYWSTDKHPIFSEKMNAMDIILV